jgi:hypothetical protein
LEFEINCKRITVASLNEVLNVIIALEYKITQIRARVYRKMEQRRTGEGRIQQIEEAIEELRALAHDTCPKEKA